MHKLVCLKTKYNLKLKIHTWLEGQFVKTVFYKNQKYLGVSILGNVFQVELFAG